MRRTTLVGSALATERALSFIDKFIDAAMIISLILWGPLACFAVGLALSLPFCASVLEWEIRTGLTGVEHLKEWAHSPNEPARHGRTLGRVQYAIVSSAKSLLRFMIRSHWATLLIGSVFYLEADYVTLLLRKRGESRMRTYVRILLPSVTWGILAWTLIYWGALEASLSVWTWIVGCEPSACLAEPGWQPVLTVLRAVEDLLR